MRCSRSVSRATRTLALAALLSMHVAVAQSAPTVVVAIDAGPGTVPRAQLLDVDPTTGTWTPAPRFAGDDGQPTAVAWDPINGQALVALTTVAGGGGVHEVRRVGFQGASAGGSRVVLGNVTAGPILDLHVGTNGDVVAIIGGMQGNATLAPRNGGIGAVATLTARQPLVFGGPRLQSVGWWVRDGSTPVLEQVDLETGSVTSGTFPLGLQRTRITGVLDLPTGAIRHLVCSDQGDVYLFEFLSALRNLPLQPTLPSGATIAMEWLGSPQVVAVGDSRHPFLIGFDPLFATTPIPWTTLAGPLPGTPVDLAIVDPGGPSMTRFGHACGSVGAGWSGRPRLGNPSLTVTVGGANPGEPLLFVIGADDQRFGALDLPWPTPFGCPLLVAANVVAGSTATAGGTGAVTLSIPATPSLAGTRAFAQWLLPTTSRASYGIALRLD